MLLLKVMRRVVPFGNYPMPMRINNRVLWINDAARSNTREIVLSELESKNGFYKFTESIPDGACVLDIGAHVGLFSIPLALKYPKVTFVCVEPNRKNYYNLWKNRNRYNLQNVIIINAGVWDRASEIVSITEKSNTGGSRTFEIPNLATAVKGFTLDDIRELFANGKKNTLWLLKMDCEGAEFKAIRNKHDLNGIQRFIGELHAGKGASYAQELHVEKLIQTIPRYKYVHLDGKSKTVKMNWT